ncbi:hypothetical protein CC78DRAFT_535558 [Lojkania enalia]|uniref:Uncharacterized protein n=1 Tax=Lojkania enalia TaxID=147567 RepID=A0A9P4N796_9PLEO|nr:hypothetical protein CC78DRAFT_535558 [Didymosphaeria enalia]
MTGCPSQTWTALIWLLYHGLAMGGIQMAARNSYIYYYARTITCVPRFSTKKLAERSIYSHHSSFSSSVSKRSPRPYVILHFSAKVEMV